MSTIRLTKITITFAFTDDWTGFRRERDGDQQQLDCRIARRDIYGAALVITAVLNPGVAQTLLEIATSVLAVL